MDSSVASLGIVVLILLIICSGFFSCSETALFSINKIKLRAMKEKEVKNIDKLIQLLDKPDELLTTILIVNNIVNITASSIATAIFLNLFGNIGMGIAMGVLTLVILLCGEILPKTLAIKNSEKISIFVAPAIYISKKCLFPIIKILSIFTKNILDNGNSNGEEKITQCELETAVDFGNENGVIDDDTTEMIHNVFDFGEIQVKDIMINRVNIVAIDVNISIDDLKSIVIEEKFSRYPVYENEVDNIIGMLNIKDLIFIDKENFNICNYLRPCIKTYEFKNANDLLKEMQKEKSHLSVVLDEYGSLAGLITIEDIIEEILGEIEDEFDTLDDKDIVKISDKDYIVTGKASLSDLNEELDIDLRADEVVSIGGYIINELGFFPNKNEKIDLGVVTAIILDINKNTILKLKLTKKLKAY